VKEIKDDLSRLNAKISQLSKSMSALVGEKTRLETRIDFLNNQYVKKNQRMCVVS
jgi:cell division protein FtsB